MQTERLAHPLQKPATAVMDLADLVSLVVCLDAPSRQVDEVVEVMLGGDKAALEINAAAVISARWLSEEIPTYSAGGRALSVLAHRRRFRIATVEVEGRGWKAEAWKPGPAGISSTAFAPTEGGAGIAAIASLTIKEKKLA